MADPKHVKILKKGAGAWNKWRDSHAKTRPDLSDANLSYANLSYANLIGAKLTGADLRGADLRGASLRGANLIGAKLTDANLLIVNLCGANLRGANLSNANFSIADLTGAKLIGAKITGADFSGTILTSAILTGANLSYANLSRAYLSGATFDGAHFHSTVLTDTDLSLAQDLSLAKHEGPSSIGIDTLYRSRGQIPEDFLRGCGVPESFITQAKALIGAEEGIQFYSCFISYSTKDDEFARRLHSRLQQANIRVWFAPHDIQGGRKLHEQIDEAIRVYDKLLILLSPNSLQSNWVMTELRKARKAERKTGQRKLFPVGLVDYPTLQEWECFDADGGQDLAVEVREYYIPDFTNWKDHDKFEAAFDRLLKDLRANAPAAGFVTGTK